MTTFKNTLMALAAPALVQDSLYPDSVDKGDALVLDYESALNEIDIWPELTEKQTKALQQLESFLNENSGDEFEEMYCDTLSLYSDQRWKEIRLLATSFIESMEWPMEKPIKNENAYTH